MANNQLNGSVDLLAQALRDVVTEAVTGAVQGIRGEIKEDMAVMEKSLREEIQSVKTDLEQRIDITNTNVQAQLAEHRKNIASDFKEALDGR